MQSEVRVYALPERVVRSMIPSGAEHRPIFSVRAMCRRLRLYPSGFYTRVRHPLNHRAQKDERQTRLLKGLCHVKSMMLREVVIIAA